VKVRPVVLGRGVGNLVVIAESSEDGNDRGEREEVKDKWIKEFIST